jgi:hypothetical protein
MSATNKDYTAERAAHRKEEEDVFVFVHGGLGGGGQDWSLERLVENSTHFGTMNVQKQGLGAFRAGYYK